MTQQEMHKIKDCRILIIGYGSLSEFISDELQNIGFCRIRRSDDLSDIADFDIVIVVNTGQPTAAVPILYPFDFIEGGGAIVRLPGDDIGVPDDADMRIWAARYMSGYCAFWNMEDCEWLVASLPLIMKGESSAQAQRTAAVICARISANIAVGRVVKHFPRFYLAENRSLLSIK